MYYLEIIVRQVSRDGPGSRSVDGDFWSHFYSDNDRLHSQFDFLLRHSNFRLTISVSVVVGSVLVAAARTAKVRLQKTHSRLAGRCRGRAGRGGAERESVSMEI